MANDKIYLDSIGIEITVEVSPGTTTGATKIELWAIKPGAGSKVIWADLTVIDATHIKYITKPEDLSVTGLYKVQVHMEFPDQVVNGTTDSFYVYNQFE